MLSMKGDFSRLRFSPAKNYTAVLQQQGRVALDSDSNEQCAINDYLHDTETVDVVGRYGGPAGDEGFDITVVGNRIEIGQGRYYVDGLLCENREPVLYGEQPFLIDPSVTDAALLSQLSQGSIRTIWVYLQVWRRLVTALDDRCLREPALGQADTTARLQTVWRVVAQAAGSATPAGKAIAASVITENSCEAMEAVGISIAPGTMTAQTGSGSGDCSCEPTPAAGYRGLENQLYRVEIHHAGSESSATFKWSRENGSVVVAVTGVSGKQVYVDSLGFDANLGFSPGQWVEITDDSYEFGSIPNQPGDLYQIQSVSPETLSVTMTQPVTAVNAALNARMRRWDQLGSSAGPNGASLAAGSLIPLENGIQVQFTAGVYESGDYWLIPARTATGQIDWPPCDSDGQAFQPPRRTEIFRAPLACIQWNSQLRSAVVSDCRKRFYPLTQLTPAAPAAALHVSSFTWVNDDITTLDQLVANGLTVTLDQAPTSPINGANFIVSFEPATAPTLTNEPGALALSQGAPAALPSTILRGITIVDPAISVAGGSISWQLPYVKATAAQRATILYLDALLSFGAPASWFARARVRLMGRAIFAGSSSGQLYLDGQSFGQPALRADGQTPRIDLALPSGDNEKTSDFEGWLYVAPTLLLVSVTVNYPALTVVVNNNNVVTGVQATLPGATAPQNVTPLTTVAVNYPAIADTKIVLSLSGAGNVASIPSSVTISRHQSAVTFPISILSNPGAATLTFQITAFLNSALGSVPTQSASFTVAGVAPPGNIQ
jgi:hypothetical protein